MHQIIDHPLLLRLQQQRRGGIFFHIRQHFVTGQHAFAHPVPGRAADLQSRLPLFPNGLYLNLNLSPENCLDPRFESDVVALMQKLAPVQVQLVIEITERRPLHFTPQLSEWFAALRKSNIAVALDDFGTGYSNLCYLHALEPEFIKIDKLFVSQIGEGGDTRIVDTLIELAQKMGLRMIAEGVETEELANLLRIFHCDEIQGYWLARPMSAEQMEAFLRDRMLG